MTEERLRDLELKVVRMEEQYRSLKEGVDKTNANTQKIFYLIGALVVKTAWDVLSSGGLPT